MTAPVYTVDETAERLRKRPRWLREWLRAHPVDQFGIPFYSPLGRTKTFDDGDIARIRATTREEERCRLGSSRPATRKRKTSTSAAATLESQLTRVRELTKGESRTASSGASKDKSSEGNIRRVNFREHRSQHS